MLDYNLEYLRAFYYAAKLKSLTKASEVLFVSQPAISQSISKLEAHLNAKLFERSSRGITLTSEGIALYQHVAAAMERLILGEQELVHMTEHSAGTLRIAATETPLYHLLLPKAQKFQKQHPQIFISISGGGSVNEAFTQLTDGQVDIAMGVSPLPDDSGLKIIEGASFSDIAVASSEFSVLKDQIISVKELCEYPVISTKQGTNARSNLDLWFAEQGILFEPTYSVQTSSIVLAFALYGLGIGILPAPIAGNMIEQKKLFEVNVAKKLPERHIVIAHLKDVPLSNLTRTFFEFLEN